MRKAKQLLRAFSLALVLVLTISLVPTAGFALADVGVSAYAAYYEFLQDEVDNLGGTMQDSDYYNMFTNLKGKNSTVEKILAAYLLDITGDGIEELILKEYITNTRGAVIDDPNTEWIRVLSYVNGSLKRIGQNQMWVEKVDNGGWSYYEPEGYIGNILSFYDYPYISDECLYYCKGANGSVYFADALPTSGMEGSFSFYAYNGTLMERTDKFEIVFAPDWHYGSISSSHGNYVYYINGEIVTESQFKTCMNSYTSGGITKLVNNDYSEVLNTLNTKIASYYNPSSWAVAEVGQAIEKGFVPESLQEGYTQPITRAEFCSLAACFYEAVTGSVIEERAEFNDTSDINVQKIGGLGVVNGVGNGNFAPDNLLTRQEAATILARLSGALGTDLPTGGVDYADRGKIASWAMTQVGQITAAGVMNGVGNNCFAPLSSYTREQAIITILRLNTALEKINA